MTIEPNASCTLQDQSGNSGNSSYPLPEDPEIRHLWRRLKQELLEIGGSQVVLQGRRHQLERQLLEGQLFTRRVQMEKGKSDCCHVNVAEFWAMDPDNVLIVTGYALDQSGVWRQHSWALKDRILYETTDERQEYFGVVLCQPEAFRFWGLHYFSLYMYDDEKIDQLIEQFPGVGRVARRMYR